MEFPIGLVICLGSSSVDFSRGALPRMVWDIHGLTRYVVHRFHIGRSIHWPSRCLSLIALVKFSASVCWHPIHWLFSTFHAWWPIGAEIFRPSWPRLGLDAAFTQCFPRRAPLTQVKSCVRDVSVCALPLFNSARKVLRMLLPFFLSALFPRSR